MHIILINKSNIANAHADSYPLDVFFEHHESESYVENI